MWLGSGVAEYLIDAKSGAGVKKRTAATDALIVTSVGIVDGKIEAIFSRPRISDDFTVLCNTQSTVWSVGGWSSNQPSYHSNRAVVSVDFGTCPTAEIPSQEPTTGAETTQAPLPQTTTTPTIAQICNATTDNAGMLDFACCDKLALLRLHLHVV